MKKIVLLAVTLGLISMTHAGLFDSTAPTGQVANNTAGAQDEMQAAAQAYERGDKFSAFTHLKNAAQRGNVVAAYNLSVAYSNGDGTPVNAEEALKWLQLAANNGYLPAQYDLALYYLSHKQAEKAAPFMQQLADKGVAEAQFNYGMMLMRGDGVNADKNLGKQYIEKAAAQKFPPAIQVLSQLQ